MHCEKLVTHARGLFVHEYGFHAERLPLVWLVALLRTGIVADDSLPAFVVLPDAAAAAERRAASNWSTDFLPGCSIKVSVFPVAAGIAPFPDLFPETPVNLVVAEGLDGFLDQFNGRFDRRRAGRPTLAAHVSALRTGRKMQASVPEAVDFSDGDGRNAKMYGLDNRPLQTCGGMPAGPAPDWREVCGSCRSTAAGRGGTPHMSWDAHEDVKNNHGRRPFLLDSRRGLLAT